MQMMEGEIPRESTGTKLCRPHDVSHRDFMFAQRADWPEFHRVVLGQWRPSYHKQKEIEWWCTENIKGRWFHSEANEVYYFEDRNSSVHFKLRWFSETRN